MAIGKVISTVVELVASLVRGFQQVIQFGSAVGGAIGAVGGFLGFGGGRAMGGPVSANTAYVVGERGPELFVPGNSGTIIPNGGGGGGTTINLTVNGAIDAEGTARTIINVLNNSAARGTLGAAGFAI
jgi:hypothetical protein